MSGERQILRRSIGVAFSDGGLLALSAVRPAGAGEHGEEQIATVLCNADGAPVEVAETLLSTEYGPDGVQRRGRRRPAAVPAPRAEGLPRKRDARAGRRPRPADELADAGAEGRGVPDGDAEQQRAGVGATVALDAPGRRDRRDRRRLRL